MVKFVGKRMSPGGQTHHHIERVWWEDTSSSSKPSGNMTVQQAVEWLDAGNKAYVVRGGYTVEVKPVHPPGHRAFIRTEPDGRQVDNLLSLPDR
jgi:hypothetical protein